MHYYDAWVNREANGEEEKSYAYSTKEKKNIKRI